MARDTQNRSVRRDASLTEGNRPVQLRESRRFFTSQGNNQAVRNAKALQGALGIGAQAYADHLGRQNVKGGNRAAAEAAQGGTRNAEDTNRGYNDTFDKVEAANDLSIFASELPQLLESEGWSDLPEAEAQASIDMYFEGQLRGIDPESTYGKIVSAGVLEQNAALLDVHRKVNTEKARQENRISIYTKTRDAYKLTGDLDHKTLMEELAVLVPGPGGRDNYLKTVFQLAEEAGDPSIIESIPERFPNGDPTGVNDPNMTDLFNTAKSTAYNVGVKDAKDRKAQYNSQNQTALAAAHAADKQLAKSGDPSVLQNIYEGGKEGPNGEPRRYTRAQQTELINTYMTQMSTFAMKGALGAAFGNGSLIGGSQDDYDSGHDSYIETVKSAIEDENPDISDEDLAGMLQKYSMERSVVNGRLTTDMKDRLSVNIRNPARFAQASELYAQLEAQLPGFAETQIGDKQARLLNDYNRLVQDVGEQGAVAAFEAYQPGRHLEPEIKSEIADYVDDAVTDIVDERSGPFDYRVTPRLQKRVREDVEHYVNMGYDLDEAQSMAAAAIKKRSVRAGDYLYGKDEGWGDDPEAILEWSLANAAAHDGVDPEMVNFVPHPNKPGYVLMQNKSTVIGGSGVPMRISEMTSTYNRYLKDTIMGTLEGSQQGSEELRLEARDRAFAKFSNFNQQNSWSEPGMRAQMENGYRKKWNELGMEQRDLLIRAEIEDEL